MQLKMIIEVEMETENPVNTEQAKNIILRTFQDIRSNTMTTSYVDETNKALVKRVTLENAYKNGFEI